MWEKADWGANGAPEQGRRNIGKTLVKWGELLAPYTYKKLDWARDDNERRKSANPLSDWYVLRRMTNQYATTEIKEKRHNCVSGNERQE